MRRISQGNDLIAQITVKNAGKRTLDNLALSQLVPAGWEIRNDRLEDVGDRGRTQAGPERPTSATGGCRRRTATRCARRSTPTSATTACCGTSACARGESIFFETRLNAAYLGQFYLPGAGIEAMYDATQHARQKGQWVEVVPAGK